MLRPDARVLLIAVALGLFATTVAAQSLSPNDAIAFDDFGFTRSTAPDARTRALLATVPVAFDVTALLENPAGLARLRARQAMASIAFADASHEYAAFGGSSTASHNSVDLEFMGGAFPIPVLRGSFVPAASVHRAFVSDLTIDYAGENETDNRDDRFFLQQTGDTHAFTVGAAIDLSASLSGGVSIFVLEGGIDALRQYDTTAHGLPGAEHTYVSEDAHYDIGGVGARIGLHMTPHPRLLVGISITTPQLVGVEGSITREETVVIPNDVGSFTRTTESVSREYMLPYRVDLGIAIPLGPVRISAQFGYADWTIASIDRERLRTADNAPVLRTVYDTRGGVEYTLPQWGLQLRAGFAHARGAPGFLEGDRIDADHLERLTSERGQLRVALGAGLRVRSVWGVDAAWSHATAERTSESVGEELRADTVTLSGSYAF